LTEYLEKETLVQSQVQLAGPICPILSYQWEQNANQEQNAPEIRQPDNKDTEDLKINVTNIK